MKKKLMVFSSLLLIIVLSSCGNQNLPVNKATSTSISTLETNVWPENEYTEHIPMPTVGTVSNGWIDLQKEYCYLELSDVSKTDSEEYMEALKQDDYEEIEKVSEEIKGQDYVSDGTLLSNGKVTLSISYLQNHFGMYISLEK